MNWVNCKNVAAATLTILVSLILLLSSRTSFTNKSRNDSLHEISSRVKRVLYAWQTAAPYSDPNNLCAAGATGYRATPGCGGYVFCNNGYLMGGGSSGESIGSVLPCHGGQLYNEGVGQCQSGYKCPTSVQQAPPPPPPPSPSKPTPMNPPPSGSNPKPNVIMGDSSPGSPTTARPPSNPTVDSSPAIESNTKNEIPKFLSDMNPPPSGPNPKPNVIMGDSSPGSPTTARPPSNPTVDSSPAIESNTKNEIPKFLSDMDKPARVTPTPRPTHKVTTPPVISAQKPAALFLIDAFSNPSQPIQPTRLPTPNPTTGKPPTKRPVSTPTIPQTQSTTVTSIMTLPGIINVPSNERDIQSLLVLVKSTIKSNIEDMLETGQTIVEIRIISIGGIDVQQRRHRNLLRNDLRYLTRHLQQGGTTEVKYQVVVDYPCKQQQGEDCDAAVDAILEQFVTAVAPTPMFTNDKPAVPTMAYGTSIQNKPVTVEVAPRSPTPKPTLQPISAEQQTYYCGYDWDWVKDNCASATPCPYSDASGVCPSGMQCIAGTPCWATNSGGMQALKPSEIQTAPLMGGDPEKRFCGYDWTDVTDNCLTATPCPQGYADSCPNEMKCIADTRCADESYLNWLKDLQANNASSQTLAESKPSQSVVVAPSPPTTMVQNSNNVEAAMANNDSSQTLAESKPSQSVVVAPSPPMTMTPKSNSVDAAIFQNPEGNQFFCGMTYVEITEQCSQGNLARPCPNGVRSVYCSGDEGCFMARSCTTAYASAARQSITTTTASTTPKLTTVQSEPLTTQPTEMLALSQQQATTINTNFCGVSWQDHTQDCANSLPCPGGDGCPAGETCFHGSPCANSPESTPEPEIAKNAKPTQPIPSPLVPGEANMESKSSNLVVSGEVNQNPPISSESTSQTQPMQETCSLCGDSTLDESQYVNLDGGLHISCSQFGWIFSSQSILEGSEKCLNFRGQYFDKCCNAKPGGVNHVISYISLGLGEASPSTTMSSTKPKPPNEEPPEPPSEEPNKWRTMSLLTAPASALTVSISACCLSVAVGLLVVI